MDDLRQSRIDSVGSHARASVSRRRFVGLGVVVGGAAAIAACAPSTPPAAPASSPAAKSDPGATAKTQPAPAPAKKLATEIRYAGNSIWPALDPHGSLSNSGFLGARQLFDALVTFDDKGEKLVPQLAAEWRRIDNTTMEFKLRDDVKFSNGEALTAETVKFNVERLMNSTNPIHAGTKFTVTGTIAGAEAVNSTTLRIKTKAPDPILLNRLTMLFMLPQKYTADGGDVAGAAIGTGNFKVTSFQTGQRIVLEAWDGGWRGKSTIQKATIDAIPEPATMIAALKRGEVDIVWQPPPDQVAAVQREGFNVALISASACTLMSLMPSHPATQDKRVREALNLAVNKEEILNTIQAGVGKLATGQLVDPAIPGHRPDLKAYPYDPERAKALIRDTGLANTDLQILTTPAVKPYADAVAGYINAAGGKARAELVELAILTQAINNRTDRPMLVWNTDYFQLRDFDAPGSRFTKENTNPHFDNEEYTKLYSQQRQELDEKKRAELIGQAAEVMHREFGALFLLWREYPYLYTKKIAKLDVPYDTA